MGKTCSTNEVEEEAYSLLVGKPEQPRSKCVDNIKMYLV
jgi:hypothetical protein